MSDECAWQLQVTTKFSHVILTEASTSSLFMSYVCERAQMMHEMEASIKIYEISIILIVSCSETSDGVA